jgi:ABC-type uncharacterized transport system involved in gliding motility auxiliary subunit
MKLKIIKSILAIISVFCFLSGVVSLLSFEISTVITAVLLFIASIRTALFMKSIKIKNQGN